MDRVLYNLWIAAALSVMERVHRRTHQGILATAEETQQVKAARRLLQYLEDT